MAMHNQIEISYTESHERLISELHKNFNPEGSPIRQLQMRLLDIMIEWDSFAKSHNIQYTIGYGTLIGAVRHRGFIPWDDDADIMMTRTEWERMNKLVEGKKLTEKLLLINDVHPKITIQGKGVVDIFILDFCPKNRLAKEWKIVVESFLFLLLKCRLRIDNRYYGHPKWWFVFMPLSILFTAEVYRNSMNRVAQWFEPRFITKNDKGCVYLGGGKAIGDEYPIHPLEKVSSVILFEGKWLSCVDVYDCYLKIGYGDYMHIPKIKTNLGRVTDTKYCKIR